MRGHRRPQAVELRWVEELAGRLPAEAEVAVRNMLVGAVRSFDRAARVVGIHILAVRQGRGGAHSHLRVELEEARSHLQAEWEEARNLQVGGHIAGVVEVHADRQLAEQVVAGRIQKLVERAVDTAVSHLAADGIAVAVLVVAVGIVAAGLVERVGTAAAGLAERFGTAAAGLAERFGTAAAGLAEGVGTAAADLEEEVGTVVAGLVEGVETVAEVDQKCRAGVLRQSIQRELADFVCYIARDLEGCNVQAGKLEEQLILNMERERFHCVPTRLQKGTSK
ncbi:hypothetical protein HDU93_003780 [Gonapodya sp. JEL0774]|nr:hypothetical protein HDU93_003780 [Gonapodya sp. JEL0774]